ncbi:phosphoribosylamine--glycine ligase [Alcaligenes sp. HPC1271]|nr:phosphoribosylamine--glycine ligase [Alcaligenes sp. HPC1271]
MKLLVVGSGGREHALAWRLAQSARVQTVYVAPGNGGTARAERIENLAITDIQELIAFVKQEKIAFTVVGPEAPLAAGIVDAFRAAGLKIFGPTQLPRSWKAPRTMPKPSWCATTSRRRPTRPLPIRTPPRITSVSKALPLWSRPMAWPLARA